MINNIEIEFEDFMQMMYGTQTISQAQEADMEKSFFAVMQRHDETMYVSESYSIDSGLSYLFDFENNRWDRFLEMITTEERFVKLFPDDDEYLNGWSHIENIQFTGLLDKNGKEIYEGDICKVINYASDYLKIHGKMYCVISWSNTAGFYGKGFGVPTTFSMGEEFEVIGNIYENHELLEQK